MKNVQESATDTLSTGHSRGLKTAMIQIPLKQRRAITGGVMLAMFLAALDGTVISTAMPTVIAQLGGFEVYSWVFSIYMLASTVSVPVWGRLSDLYGRKNFYLIGIALFVVGSALAGQSDSMTMLILTRAIQGLGAGAMFPVGMTIIGEIYSLEQRAKMQGLFSGVWGLASIIGPLAGGFITDTISWRWVFYINLPFGIAAAAVIWFAMKRQMRGKEKVKVDYLGALTLTVSMSLLLLGLLRAGEASSWGDPGVIGMLVSSLVLFIFFFYWEARVEEPIFPLELLKNQIFSAASISGLFVGMAMFGTITYLPLFVQAVLGGSATEAGTSLTPFMLGWTASSALGGRLMLRIGYRPTIFIGMAFLITGFFLFTTFNMDTGRIFLLSSVGLAGMGMGLIILSMILAVQNSVSQRQLGIATSASLFTRSIGATVGVAILGTVLTLSMQQGIGQLSLDDLSVEQQAQVNKLAANPDSLVAEVGESYDPKVMTIIRGTLADALHIVFIFGLGFAVLAFLTSFLIPKGKAEEHSFKET